MQITRIALILNNHCANVTTPISVVGLELIKPSFHLKPSGKKVRVIIFSCQNVSHRRYKWLKDR